MKKIVEALNFFIQFLNGFRKFIFAMAIFFAASGFLVAKILNGVEYVDLMKTTVMAFMAINGVEHVTGTVQTWLLNKAAPIVAKIDGQGDQS